MRFGHFFYPMNLDPARDYQFIDACLDEAELVEQLGFDAIWIAEHHFVGEAVYGDALLFGAAVAVKTQRVLIGLGVVEMALHNPVQLAIQTALLDNLSRGRLVGEHSVILTPHREAFYNREKLVNHPVGKDSPWDKLRFSRYPRFVQENNGTTCAKTSISALTSGLMTSKHVYLTRQAPYPRSATWCGSYAKTSRAVSLKRCSTMLTHRSTTERRPLVPSVSGASRLALP